MAQRFLIVLVALFFSFIHIKAQSIKKLEIDSSHNQPAYLSQHLNMAFKMPLTTTGVRPDYYSKQLGFFCKKELQIQKFTQLPVYFRLGSLDYVNKMEGKK